MRPVRQALNFILPGIAAAVFGGFIFFRTQDFSMILAICLGGYAFITGLSSLIMAVSGDYENRVRNVFLIRGILNVIIGLLAVLLPLAAVKITWIIILYVLAGQLIISAVLQIYSAQAMKRKGRPINRTLVGSAVSIGLALLIILMPQETGDLVLRVFAVLVFFTGITLIVFGINGARKRSAKEHLQRGGGSQTSDDWMDQPPTDPEAGVGTTAAASDGGEASPDPVSSDTAATGAGTGTGPKTASKPKRRKKSSEDTENTDT